MKLVRKLPATALLLLASGAMAGSPTRDRPRVEVFYRSFDSTSIVDLDAAALSSANDHHLVLEKPSQLEALAKSLPNACIPEPPEHVRDLRLLISWSGATTWSWEASQFGYRDSRTGITCQFSRRHQDAVLATLGLER